MLVISEGPLLPTLNPEVPNPLRGLGNATGKSNLRRAVNVFRDKAGNPDTDRSNSFCKTCHKSPISGDGLFDVNQFEGVPDVRLATGNHRFSNFPLQELDIPDG